MRIAYVLLSPTFGMHQYTADLANRMAATGAAHRKATWDVHLVTTCNYPHDRYAPQVCVHTPVATRNTGLGRETLHSAALRQALHTVLELQPDLVHVTGPHLWNIPLLRTLRRRRIPSIHTIHDLDPHRGARLGPMLHLWNACIIRLADLILVHGERYRYRLLGNGVPAQRVAYAPLLHLFLSHECEQRLRNTRQLSNGHRPSPLAPAPALAPTGVRLLFFGRLQRYKGIDLLLKAYRQLQNETDNNMQLVLAGPGELTDVWEEDLPPGVEFHNRLIDDAEAVTFFRNCDLLLLPYSDATQSALVAAAYFFAKPVLVSRSGALPEYVHDGQTGFVVNPDDPGALTRVLSRVAAQPERLPRLGQNGRRWYERQRAQEWATLQHLYSKLASFN